MTCTFSTDINATKVTIGAVQNDVMLTVPTSATPAQVQTAVNKIMGYINGAGTAALKSWEGLSGRS